MPRGRKRSTEERKAIAENELLELDARIEKINERKREVQQELNEIEREEREAQVSELLETLQSKGLSIDDVLALLQQNQ